MIEPRNIYMTSYTFLVNEAVSYGLSANDIDIFISTPLLDNCHEKTAAFEFMLNVLQDFYCYPNEIKFDERREQILASLNGGDIGYTAVLNEAELFRCFSNLFEINSEYFWHNYCKSIISGAKYMNSFPDDQSFTDTLRLFNSTDDTRIAYALLLSNKIFNMGFAVACNWLKELGYIRLAKPDKHIKDICKALGLISSDDNDIRCVEEVIKIADESGVTPYRLDRIWWLICTGKISLEIQLPNPQMRKRRFIEILTA